jgi:hypothetical protein
MNSDSTGQSSFLRPFWSRILPAPWIVSLLVLAVLAAARFYAAFTHPSTNILFPLHCLAMWALPFILLTPRGCHQIGLPGMNNTVSALVLSALAGAACGIAVFAIGMALYGDSPDNWCLSIRNSFQIEQLRASVPPVTLFAAVALPAVIFTPVGEEILFRGLLQEAFTLRWNAVLATVVNSVAFGLIHLHVHGFWHDAAGFHFRFVSAALMVVLLAGVSTVFTFCRLRTGSLFAAITAHAACNLAMVAAVFLYYV